MDELEKEKAEMTNELEILTEIVQNYSTTTRKKENNRGSRGSNNNTLSNVQESQIKLRYDVLTEEYEQLKTEHEAFKEMHHDCQKKISILEEQNDELVRALKESGVLDMKNGDSQHEQQERPEWEEDQNEEDVDKKQASDDQEEKVEGLGQIDSEYAAKNIQLHGDGGEIEQQNEDLEKYLLNHFQPDQIEKIETIFQEISAQLQEAKNKLSEQIEKNQLLEQQYESVCEEAQIMKQTLSDLEKKDKNAQIIKLRMKVEELNNLLKNSQEEASILRQEKQDLQQEVDDMNMKFAQFEEYFRQQQENGD